jgi:hypothetical protein
MPWRHTPRNLGSRLSPPSTGAFTSHHRTGLGNLSECELAPATVRHHHQLQCAWPEHNAAGALVPLKCIDSCPRSGGLWAWLGIWETPPIVGKQGKTVGGRQSENENEGFTVLDILAVRLACLRSFGWYVMDSGLVNIRWRMMLSSKASCYAVSSPRYTPRSLTLPQRVL